LRKGNAQRNDPLRICCFSCRGLYLETWRTFQNLKHLQNLELFWLLPGIAAIVRGPEFFLKSDEDSGPLGDGPGTGHLEDEQAVLPDAVVLCVVSRRIALIHVYVVDAIACRVERAKCVDRPCLVRNGLIEELDDCVFQVLRGCFAGQWQFGELSAGNQRFMVERT
jgi:hypothetical protein